MRSRISVWLMCLSIVVPVAAAQGQRRGTGVSGSDQVETTTSIKPPAALVYVMQTIDLSQQLGGEENILTLDGEPLPPMLVRNITLGLVLDESGHIATRLVGINPKNPPQSILVTPQQGRPTKARFLGLDSATGLSIVEVAGEGFSTTAPSKEKALAPRQLRLFGFNAAQAQSQSPSMGFARPRIHSFVGRVGRAINDFRYQATQPIFRLLTPKLTPVQDCSLVVDNEGTIFGMAITDTTEEGQNLVYPISRLNAIAEAVMRSKDSLAHGWLGATGVTMYAPITNSTRPQTADLGVRITGVLPDSPAEQAGVKVHDILLAINDHAIASVEQLSTTLKQLSAYSQVSLRLKRGAEIKVLSAKLAPAPAFDSGQQPSVLAKQLRGLEDRLRSLEPTDPARRELEPKVTAMRSVMANILGPAPIEVKLRIRYGIEVEQLSTQLLRYFAVPNGLLVVTVNETDRGARSGLRAGDVIVAIGNIPVNDATALLKALDESSDQPLVLAVSRQREQVQLTVARDLP